jgi:hypothetical protein
MKSSQLFYHMRAREMIGDPTYEHIGANTLSPEKLNPRNKSLERLDIFVNKSTRAFAKL